MAEKNDSPKTPPQPQNTGAPERPKFPENRPIHGNDPTRTTINAIDTVHQKP